MIAGCRNAVTSGRRASLCRGGWRRQKSLRDRRRLLKVSGFDKSEICTSVEYFGSCSELYGKMVGMSTDDLNVVKICTEQVLVVSVFWCFILILVMRERRSSLVLSWAVAVGVEENLDGLDLLLAGTVVGGVGNRCFLVGDVGSLFCCCGSSGKTGNGKGNLLTVNLGMKIGVDLDFSGEMVMISVMISGKSSC